MQSPAQRQYLQRMNEKLAVIDQHVKCEAITLITQLEARVQNPTDWLSDYEIELEVTFWLHEDDPAYQEDDDTVVFQKWR
jgi:hypothetical protein